MTRKVPILVQSCSRRGCPQGIIGTRSINSAISVGHFAITVSWRLAYVARLPLALVWTPSVNWGCFRTTSSDNTSNCHDGLSTKCIQPRLHIAAGGCFMFTSHRIWNMHGISIHSSDHWIVLVEIEIRITVVSFPLSKDAVTPLNCRVLSRLLVHPTMIRFSSGVYASCVDSSLADAHDSAVLIEWFCDVIVPA